MSTKIPPKVFVVVVTKNEFHFPTRIYRAESHHIFVSTEEFFIYALSYSKPLLYIFMLITRCHTVAPAFHYWIMWILKINNVRSYVLTGCLIIWNSLRLHKIYQKKWEEGKWIHNNSVKIFLSSQMTTSWYRNEFLEFRHQGSFYKNDGMFPENLCTW